MYPDRDTFAQSLQRAEYSSMFFLYDYLRESLNIRHGLMLLWFTDLMNVTEEVTIHGPKVSTLLSSAFIRGDLNAAKRGSFYMIKALNVWSLGKLVCFLSSLYVSLDLVSRNIRTLEKTKLTVSLGTIH